MQFKGLGIPSKHFATQKCFCIDENIACRCRRCIYVCPACYNYETSQRAFQIWKSFCNQDRLFSSSTWSGRLFFCTKIFAFATAASRASWYQLAIFESDFSNPTSKTLVGLRPNPTFSTKLCWMCILSSKSIMTHKGAGTVQPSLFLPKFSSPFLATRRKWRIFKSFCWHSSIFVVIYSNNLI